MTLKKMFTCVRVCVLMRHGMFLSFSNHRLSVCLSCWLALCAALCTVNATHGGKGKSNMAAQFPSHNPCLPLNSAI